MIYLYSLLVAALFALPAGAWANAGPGVAGPNVGGGGGGGGGRYTVATLPSSPAEGTVVVVTDGSPPDPCNFGGGPVTAHCVRTASSTWAPLSGGNISNWRDTTRWLPRDYQFTCLSFENCAEGATCDLEGWGAAQWDLDDPNTFVGTTRAADYGPIAMATWTPSDPNIPASLIFDTTNAMLDLRDDVIIWGHVGLGNALATSVVFGFTEVGEDILVEDAAQAGVTKFDDSNAPENFGIGREDADTDTEFYAYIDEADTYYPGADLDGAGVWYDSSGYTYFSANLNTSSDNSSVEYEVWQYIESGTFETAPTLAGSGSIEGKLGDWSNFDVVPYAGLGGNQPIKVSYLCWAWRPRTYVD